MVAAKGHAVDVMRLEHPRVCPSQPAPGAGQGQLRLGGTHCLCGGLTTLWRIQLTRRQGRVGGRRMRLRGLQWLCGGLITLWCTQVSRRQGRGGAEGCGSGADSGCAEG